MIDLKKILRRGFWQIDGYGASEGNREFKRMFATGWGRANTLKTASVLIKIST